MSHEWLVYSVSLDCIRLEIMISQMCVGKRLLMKFE